MFHEIILNPNGITNGISGRHRRMAVEPVFMGESGDFRENTEIGLIWFYLVSFGSMFPHCFPMCFPIFD